MTGSSFSFPVTLSPGLNTVEITATAIDGKSASIKLTISLNAALTLAVTSPAHDIKSSSALTMSGIFTGTPPITLEISMDGQTYFPTETSGTFSQALTFSNEKNYPVLVTASDTQGNSVTVTRNINFVRLGDQDGSGSIDLADVLKAYKISQGVEQTTEADISHCDVAPLDADGRPLGNGIIDLGDVIILLRYLVGIRSW